MTFLHPVWLLLAVPLGVSLLLWRLPSRLLQGLRAVILLLVLLGLGGVAMGLALSALVPTPDSANSLLPYVMIPQLIFGGGIMTVGAGLLYLLAGTFSSVYWGFGFTILGCLVAAFFNFRK